jgi:hypothetical protein
MKKLAMLSASLLLLLSTSVFAGQHSASALEHAKAAVAEGKAGHTAGLLEHAKAALEDASEATIVTKGVAKNHLEVGAEELQEAIDHGNMGHIGVATSHAEAAVAHIKAGNK